MKTVIKKIVFFVCLLFSKNIFSQHIGLNWLFQTGFRVGWQAQSPQNFSDSLQFSLQNFHVSAIIPLSGKANLDIKKLDFKAQQTFLTMQAGLRHTQLSQVAQKPNLYTLSIGLTHIRASIWNGFWLYYTNMGILRDLESSQNDAFFVGAFAKIKVKGLRKQNIYGVALSYNFGNFLPIPLLGFNRKLSEKWDIHLLLPLQAAFLYRLSSKTDIRLQSQIQFFRVSVKSLENWTKNSSQLSFQEIRTGILFRQKIAKNRRLLAEVGWSDARSLDFWDKENQLVQKNRLNGGLYWSFSLQFDVGNSPIGSQLFGNSL